MLLKGTEIEREGLYQVARLMCVATRTAPKGGGIDNIETAIAGGAIKAALASEMRRMGASEQVKAYLLNADDVEKSELVVLIGTKLKRYRIKSCNFCGFEGCSENKKANGICAVAVGDLGVAIGSAASVAGRNFVDNRIMFTIGRAALNLKILDEDIKIAYGIPLSATGKSPYFDREWKKTYGVEKWTVK